MKLNAMVMSIDDRLPELADFKRMLATGNSRFWKGNYLYVVEQALIADRYYWLYLQYDNANLYAPYVVDITDDAVKDIPVARCYIMRSFIVQPRHIMIVTQLCLRLSKRIFRRWYFMKS